MNNIAKLGWLWPGSATLRRAVVVGHKLLRWLMNLLDLRHLGLVGHQFIKMPSLLTLW